MCSRYQDTIIVIEMPEWFNRIILVTLLTGLVVCVANAAFGITHLIVETMREQVVNIMEENLPISSGMTILTLIFAVTAGTATLISRCMQVHPVHAMTVRQQIILPQMAKITTLHGQRSVMTIHTQRHSGKVMTGSFHTGTDTLVALLTINFTRVSRVSEFRQKTGNAGNYLWIIRIMMALITILPGCITIVTFGTEAHFRHQVIEA